MNPLTDVREISRIGYGFIGSKVLFAVLDFEIERFTANRSDVASFTDFRRHLN